MAEPPLHHDPHHDPHHQRTADHWSQMAKAQIDTPQQRADTCWLDSPLVQHGYINPAVSGQPTANWLEWAVRTHIPPTARHACTLGCGAGGLERHARWLGLAAQFDAFDISPGSIEVARAEAGKRQLTGIDYHCANLEHLELPQRRYDVVFGSMSLHHFHNLEAVLHRVRDALVPGGLLIWNEFVGPRRFQWTDLQLELVQALLQTLPDALRADLRTGAVKQSYPRLSIAEMDAIDPSEAALSDLIVPLSDQLFERVLLRDYGGTLLHLALEGIVGNFHLEVPADVAHLRRLFAFEAACLAARVLPSDFAVGVYRRPA